MKIRSPRKLKMQQNLRGFALVAVLVILALLVVVIMLFSMNLQVETRSSSTQRNLLEARQNALLGLEVAIGQLQTYAGKDQAVTAPATAVYPEKDPSNNSGELIDLYQAEAETSASRSYLDTARTYLTPEERDSWDETLQQWWQDKNPRWTAVYDASLRSSIPASSVVTYEEDPDGVLFGEPDRNQLPLWLIAGNEHFHGTFDPATAADYPTDYLTPETSLPDPTLSNNMVWLVGEGSATDATESVDGLDGRVKAPKQDIATIKPDGTEEVAGHYSYWIADESTKANFAARDPFADEDLEPKTPPSNDVELVQYRNRLQSPQRMGWENLDGFQNLNQADPKPNDERLEWITTSKEISLLEETEVADIQDAAKSSFHDLTAFSSSLLTDTARGGLKKDLTYFMEGGNNNTPSLDSSVADSSDYSSQDERFGQLNAGFPGTSFNIPTWRDIRSWYTNEAVGSGGGTITPSPDSAAPALTFWRMFTGMSVEGNYLRMNLMPSIVLWNPYDASLAEATYEIEIGWGPRYWQVFVGVPALPEEGTLPQRPAIVDPSTPWVDANEDGRHDNLDDLFVPTAGSDSPFDGANDRHGNFYYYINNVQPGFWSRNRTLGTPDPVPETDEDGDYIDEDGNKVEDPDDANQIYLEEDTSLLAGRDLVFRFFLFDDGDDNWDQPGRKPGSSIVEMAGDLDGDGDADDNTELQTLIRFTVTTSFEAGESKIFSIGEDVIIPGNDVAGWFEDNTIPLVNALDTVAPASMSFRLFELGGPAPPTNGDLRYFMNTLGGSIHSPYVRLSMNNITISETLSFGDIGGGSLGGNLTGEDWNDEYSDQWDGDDTTNNHEIPNPKGIDRWRKAYATSSFADFVDIDDQRSTESSAFSVGAAWFDPLILSSRGHIGDRSQNTHYFSPFARMNLGAASFSPHPRIDIFRSKWPVNNADQFETLRQVRSTEAEQWDTDVADGANAYSLLTPMSTSAYEGLQELPIRNVKRADSEVLSIGRLQAVNLSPFYWQPTFPIGNSEASLYTDREKIAGINSRKVSVHKNNDDAGSERGYFDRVPNDQENTMLDISYLLNETLWDRYYFSSIPQSSGALDLDQPLPNSRHRFRETLGSELNESNVRDFNNSAAYLRNEGALNVNSTSVGAWKALLTAFRDLALVSISNDRNPEETTPISRSLTPIANAVDFTLIDDLRDLTTYGADGARDYSNLVAGFRYLDDDMIESLAERIVDEVRLRGPFLSMSDFVNRRLVAPDGSGEPSSAWSSARTESVTRWGDADYIAPAYDPMKGLTGLTGAIQRAINLSGINGGVNHWEGSSSSDDRVFQVAIRSSGNETGNGDNDDDYTPSSGVYIGNDPALRGYLDSEHVAGAPAGEAGQLFSHSPGFISQGDILAMIGPALTPRGDTFLIRTYGDAVNPNSQEVESRAWLEAVVQRVPEPVNPSDTDVDGTEAKWIPKDKFGRKFEIISLRWLNEDEV